MCGPLRHSAESFRNMPCALQVALAMFKDPPHQPHETRLLPGVQAPAPELTQHDTPRLETPWCLQHDERMAMRQQQNPHSHHAAGSMHPMGERRDFRYATVVRLWTQAMSLCLCRTARRFCADHSGTCSTTDRTSM